MEQLVFGAAAAKAGAWWDPFCAGPAFNPDTFDLAECFEDSTLSLVPVVIIALMAAVTAHTLVKRYSAGEHPEKGGRGAFALKLAANAGLVVTQIVWLVLLAVKINHFWSDYKFSFGLVTLVALLLSLALRLISHPILPHSSSALLFFDLTSIVFILIRLRTSLSLYGNHIGTHQIVLAVKLVLFLVSFNTELLGPDGWDKMSWRDWVPFVAPADGKIRLDDAEQPAAPTSVDDDDEWIQPECPRLRANIFERLTFSWMTPMMKMGKQKFLTEEDLWSLPPEDTAHALGLKLERQWDKRVKAQEGKKGKPSLGMALTAAYGWPFFIAGFFKFLQDTLAFVQPQLLKRLLQFISSYKSPTPEPAIHGWVLALSMFACAIVQTLCLHVYFDKVFTTGMRVRAGLVALIYKKSLVLSNEDRSGRNTGDIVNLQSTDSTRLQDLCTYGQIGWSGVYQITLAFISLYALLGWTMFIGVGVMVASIPLTGYIARTQTKMQRAQMKNKDKRTSIMNEILTNIRTIKLYAWEGSFAQRLFDVRNNKELVMLRRMGYLQSSSNFLWSVTPFAVAFTTFAAFVGVGHNPLTSEIVFPAITLFNLLGFPLAVLPVVFSALVEAFVSLERLSDFLCGSELQKDAIKIESSTRELQAGDELVSVRHADFSWNSKSAEPTLSDINLSVKKGELLAVVGRVGSGKSSLLSAILGEMTKTDGSVTLRGTVAYVPQSPWIMGGTLRSNITFGHRFDKEFYDIVLEACALLPDLAILQEGDQTQIGEKGINLSGGQKARISLARAVYARADIYFLDDPLSAVDAHVGKHLFDRVLGPDGLLQEKARVLCTNAIPYCEQADELILIRGGVIIERGTYASSINGDSELSRLLAEYGKNVAHEDGDDNDEEETGSDGTAVALNVVPPEELEAKLAEDLSESDKHKAKLALTKKAELVPVEEQKRATLLELKRSTRPKETRAQGSVGWQVYKNYIKANTYLGCIVYIGTILLQQALQISTNVWLKSWAQRNAQSGDNGDTHWFLSVYAALGFGASTVFLINGICLYSYCVINSATYMHDNAFNAVLRSPQAFFDRVPIGVILNRFSKDVNVVDEVLARTFGGFARTLASVLSTIVVIAYSAPAFLLLLLPLLVVYGRVQRYYLATSRELKRLDATTKSPIFGSFSETLSGVATIRAYRQASRFTAENEARVDRNQEAYFPSVVTNRWLAVRLEFIGALIIFSTAALAVWTLTTTGTIDAGTAGLMLSYALQSTQTLNWIVRSSTEVETNVVSVERLEEYIQLPSEAPSFVKETEPAADWPQHGNLSFSHVNARYRPDLDLVAKDVSFEIKAGQRVGVCGRTGAGKSSLTMILYRIIELASGKVEIDGVDVSKIGLHTLRSRLSILPQDAQCFEGTLRENLDPSGQATDAELWSALDKCSLKKHIEAMDGKLDAHIDEAGGNLSQGQRQLMSLGRAMLRNSKILVLDEATAAIDPESDKEIQQVIRSEFKDCTIFVIAHRINTVIDSDMILVMDQGQVKEFAPPQELLADKASIFYSLARGSKGSGSTPGTRPATAPGTPQHKD